MSEKIKIAMVAKNLEINGISSVIMNYCRNINKELYEITIFAGIPINNIYYDECIKMGINVIQIPNKNQKVKYYIQLYKKMEKNKFDIIHVHGNSIFMIIELVIGYMKKINVRAAHSHNTRCRYKLLQKLIQPIFNKLSTLKFACGTLAGTALFGEKEDFIVIPNGIDTEKYKFNIKARNKKRSELNIQNKFVIGHIGRINEQKNQEYLIKIFEKVANDNKDAVLLLVGIGPDYEKIKNNIEANKYSDRIILYGESTEPEILYMAMDCFVFPSKFEGLPLTVVEAQISGLYCVISDIITDEVIFTNIVNKETISDDTDKWKLAIQNIKSIDRNQWFELNKKNIKKFEIKENVNILEEAYQKYFK